MVHKRFENSFGPASGEDDRTDFLYDRQNHEALKRLVDDVDITIYRDGNAVEDGNLDVLIREAEPSDYQVNYQAEMIPVHGAISRVETLWIGGSPKQYKIFSRPDRFEIGVMSDGILKVLSVWNSQDAYMRANPEARLDTENVEREHTPQEPIVFHFKTK